MVAISESAMAAMRVAELSGAVWDEVPDFAPDCRMLPAVELEPQPAGSRSSNGNNRANREADRTIRV